ncbi:hypothetical protein V6N11_035758 [Hibiscus sabdariffa]|uniref:Uncharacterized protein n=1 Tax=Hibiscus sabdariffa TaxID=183260 RepID=A0ABR2R8D0_9ROSI
MGVEADDFHVLFHGSDDVVGSRWCESRSWLHLGLRTVRLVRPFIGLRFPSRLLCQVWNEVHGAGGNFRCGKGTCCLSVLQVPVHVFTPVDWYGLVGGRGWYGGVSDLVWPWFWAVKSIRRWMGVERGFQLLFEVCVDRVRWLRMERARWGATLFISQDPAGHEGFTVVVQSGRLTGEKFRWITGYIKDSMGRVRFKWKWWRWRWWRFVGLEGRGRDEAGLVALGWLEVRDEGDTWQGKEIPCMGFTSWGSTWDCAGDRAGPTVTALLDCWPSNNTCGNMSAWILIGGKLVEDSCPILTVLINDTLRIGKDQ